MESRPQNPEFSGIILKTFIHYIKSFALIHLYTDEFSHLDYSGWS